MVTTFRRNTVRILGWLSKGTIEPGSYDKNQTFVYANLELTGIRYKFNHPIIVSKVSNFNEQSPMIGLQSLSANYDCGNPIVNLSLTFALDN